MPVHVSRSGHAAGNERLRGIFVPYSPYRLMLTLALTLMLMPIGMSALPVPGTADALAAYPVEFTDAGGARISLSGPPQRVVSLVPGITEILFELGAGDAVKGVTWHDTFPLDAVRKEVVGGFLSPSLQRIEALTPDVVFLSSPHREARDRFAAQACRTVQLECGSIADIYRNIELLGAIFDREERAAELAGRIGSELDLVARKVSKIPVEDRKRVIRIMGRDEVTTPGDDSFQNEFIRAAGGVPPRLGRKGGVVGISLEEWKRFNPQVIYGCGGDKEIQEKFFCLPGWRDVDAVRNGRIHYFPCELTCRASAHAGYFVEWLASTINEEAFSKPENQVLEDRVVASVPVDLPLEYVKSARVDEATVFDFPSRTLIVDFKEPLRVLSTLEGERTGVTSVGNHGTPPPCWGISHRIGLDGSRDRIYRAVGKRREDCSLLFTGADMRNLSVREARFREMAVYALVTAGVQGNAVRMSRDEGRYYEPGTINIIILTNMQLSPRAMARAVISATEAKTASLQDLDIRGGDDPLRCQATGTGTDEMIVVSGRGRPVENAGGHSKLGELIARAVHDGVTEAVSKQNAVTPERSVFHRLRERGISPDALARRCSRLAGRDGAGGSGAGGSGVDDGSKAAHRFLERLEEILLEPRHAAFVETALALSDQHERGRAADPAAFDEWRRRIADDIAGGPVGEWKEFLSGEDIPVVVRMSLNALLNGISGKQDRTRGAR